MVTFIQIINPRLELHNYPLEIRKTVVPKTKEEKKKFNILAIPMFVILIVYLLGTITMAYSMHATRYSILFLHSFIVIMTWNIFDLLIMDWLIFCTITPKYLIIPGTEDNDSYKDYRYHINGSLGKGLILAIISITICSGVSWLILKLFIW
ncbi:hypothetical protein GOQ27_09895 [Clostridium sp. D2Q-11]|uniref:Uncharacterized protein n=1 Tax=Anaeromonas frigoriresistens TaxID=2683708 RepID=A0A942Z7J8_9FIRM|nr:hypothetical protein [Anaeromonas frigoriresistens]MBS4538777.1 hypothetical protein [Anaeromonas frigoriresistens]